jgi:hypothetical protein
MAFHKLHRLAATAATVLGSSTACERTFFLSLSAEGLPWKSTTNEKLGDLTLIVLEKKTCEVSDSEISVAKFSSAS